MALAVFVCQGAQRFELLQGLDSSGHHARAKAPEARRSYALMLRIAAEARNEGALDLEKLTGPCLR